MNAYIPELILHLCALGYTWTWVHDANQLQAGELCFYLSYGKIVGTEMLSKFKHNLVVHGSDLPKGKGWSPLTWQVLAGDKKHPLTLIEADFKVDSGVIYAQNWYEFEDTELIEEMRQTQAVKTLALCRHFIENYPDIIKQAKAQIGIESFYSRRRSKDSELDINLTLKQQFNLLRVVDNQSYPAFFTFAGKRYNLKIEQADK